MTLPLIGILPQREWPGLNGLTGEPIPRIEVMSIDQAFRRQWETDAHCVTYKLSGHGDEALQARVNKVALFPIRQHNAEVLTTCFGIDYDNPDHQPWTEHGLTEFYDRLTTVAERWPLAWGWSAFYTTRKGARFFYVLDQPIPSDRAEGKHRWLVQQFQAAGIAVDAGCSDWTRVFRLPHVMRGGIQTWTEPLTMLVEQWDNVLPVASIPDAVVAPSAYAEIVPIQRARPLPDDAQQLLWQYSPATNRKIHSEWARQAKRRLTGRECFPCLFDHAPLAQPGSRDSTLHSYVGQAVAMCQAIPQTTPEHIYALFVDPVMQLDPDESGRDWLDILWDHILRLWVKEEAKVQVQTEVQQQQGADLLNGIIEGMKEWCDRPELYADETTARAFALRHLIVGMNTGKGGYSIMRPDGYYNSQMISSTHLVPQIRHMGMDRLIPIQVPSGKGFRAARGQEIIDEYATLIGELQSRPCIGGAYIEDMDGPNARMVVESYRRNHLLSPEFDADVDEWLQIMFGVEYPKVAHWLGWALAFEDGPICALSMQGPPSTGKKMFIQGLCECLLNPQKATGDDLTGKWQYGLAKTPFIHIDEAWPRDNSGKHPADVFRERVGGEKFPCDQKFLAPLWVFNPARIVFTANNRTVVQILAGNKNLSPDDRAALGLRLIHVDINPQAATWLNEERGGLSFTGAQGRRWIASDSGLKSDFVIAKHFLWLHKNRKGPKGNRLLVEGTVDSTIMQELRTQSGHTPIVIESIIHMLESQQRRDGLVVEGDKLYVLPSEVLSYYRANLQHHSSEKLTANSISGVFKSLALGSGNGDIKAFILESRKDVGAREWHEVDCALLLGHAMRVGHKSPKLEALCIKQRQGLASRLS